MGIRQNYQRVAAPAEATCDENIENELRNKRKTIPQFEYLYSPLCLTFHGSKVKNESFHYWET